MSQYFCRWHQKGKDGARRLRQSGWTRATRVGTDSPAIKLGKSTLLAGQKPRRLGAIHRLVDRQKHNSKPCDRYFCAISITSGNSSLHGPHQLAQGQQGQFMTMRRLYNLVLCASPRSKSTTAVGAGGDGSRYPTAAPYPLPVKSRSCQRRSKVACVISQQVLKKNPMHTVEHVIFRRR